MNEPLFDIDEMNFCKVEQDWGMDEILSQEGLFFLKDVANILCLTNQLVKIHVEALLASNRNPYDTMGVRKLWGHWVLRMKVFAPYYKNHLCPKYLPVRAHWDGNELLKQKGLYRLSEVCKKIPFSHVQLRTKAREPHARTKFGMFKDEDSAHYLVDMEIFSVWLQRVWHNDFQDERDTSDAPVEPIGSAY